MPSSRRARGALGLNLCTHSPSRASLAAVSVCASSSPARTRVRPRAPCFGERSADDLQADRQARRVKPHGTEIAGTRTRRLRPCSPPPRCRRLRDRRRRHAHDRRYEQSTSANTRSDLPALTSSSCRASTSRPCRLSIALEARTRARKETLGIPSIAAIEGVSLGSPESRAAERLGQLHVPLAAASRPNTSTAAATADSPRIQPVVERCARNAEPQFAVRAFEPASSRRAAGRAGRIRRVVARDHAEHEGRVFDALVRGPM